MRAPAILVAIAVSVVMHAHEAAAQPTNITECGTIAAPGSYVLVGNLSASDDCLVIGVDFVTIDLGGFVITGNGRGTGILARPPSVGITIRNGTITDFSLGVGLGEASGSKIEGIRAIGNGEGLSVGSDSIVKDNVVLDSARFGIFALHGSALIDNVSSRNSFGIVSGLGNTIIGNTVRENTIAGIVALEGSTVTENTSILNNGSGIQALIGSTVSTNTARGNNGNGILVSCPSNVIANTATDNNGNLAVDGPGCRDIDNLAPGVARRVPTPVLPQPSG